MIQRRGTHPKRSHFPTSPSYFTHAHTRVFWYQEARCFIVSADGWRMQASSWGYALHISALTHVQLFFSLLSLWRHPFAPPHWCYPPISGLSRAAPGQLVACLQPLSALFCLRVSPLPLSSFNSLEWLAYRRREELSSASEQENKCAKGRTWENTIRSDWKVWAKTTFPDWWVTRDFIFLAGLLYRL